MKKIIILSLSVAIALGFTSCEKAFFDKETENTPSNNFEYLWTELNNKYAFFELKNINPEALHQQYASQINDDMEDTALFRVMGNMLNELRDGHVNLISGFNTSRYDVTLLGVENINERLVKTHYLKPDYYSTGGFAHNFIGDSTIAYIRYSSFLNTISNYDLNFIIDRYKNTNGLIIDIRQNGGGAVTNVFMLLSRFVFDERVLYETQIKTGAGSNDFTTLKKVYSEPNDEKKYHKPVAILTDRGSYSASSFFSVCTYAFDNIFMVGDTTGGGLGLPNGGQLPNGWTYRFSVTRTIAVDGGNYENGVPPDYTVILSKDSVENNIDNVIEFAARKLTERNNL